MTRTSLARIRPLTRICCIWITRSPWGVPPRSKSRSPIFVFFYYTPTCPPASSSPFLASPETGSAQAGRMISCSASFRVRRHPGRKCGYSG